MTEAPIERFRLCRWGDAVVGGQGLAAAFIGGKRLGDMSQVSITGDQPLMDRFLGGIQFQYLPVEGGGPMSVRLLFRVAAQQAKLAEISLVQAFAIIDDAAGLVLLVQETALVQ